jgi:hypothetical protein
MEENHKLQAQATFIHRERALGTHQTEEWLGHRTVMDIVEKRRLKTPLPGIKS